MERQVFNDSVRKIIRVVGCSEEETNFIYNDPNFLLEYWAKYMNLPDVTFIKIVDSVIEEYNPSAWHGKAIYRKREFNRTFPMISEFHKFYENIKVIKNPDLKPKSGDGEGLPGLAEYLKQSIAKHKSLSPEERREQALKVPELIKSNQI